MVWGRYLSPTLGVLVSLILIVALITVVQGQILEPVGKIITSKPGPIGYIPISYGPCKKCRDFIATITLKDNYKWYYISPGNVWPIGWVKAKINEFTLILKVGRKEASLSENECTSSSRHFCTNTITSTLIFYNVANDLIYVYYNTHIKAFTWSGKSAAIVLTDSGYYDLITKVLNVFYPRCTAIAGFHVLKLIINENSKTKIVKKETHGIAISPLYAYASYQDARMKEPAYAQTKAIINYYYTLELGLLARAYWLNGTPVNLPSIGIVDGYVPTKYWKVLKVYPGSAFSRNHAVVLKDNYGYYIYYVVPNAVFSCCCWSWCACVSCW